MPGNVIMCCLNTDVLIFIVYDSNNPLLTNIVSEVWFKTFQRAITCLSILKAILRVLICHLDINRCDHMFCNVR